MEFTELLNGFLLVAAGILTGIINTVAGSGTIVSLGVMLFFGIPLNLANTTNRLGVFFQNVSALTAYKRHYDNQDTSVRWLETIGTLIGALVGAYAASVVTDAPLKWVALFALAVSFVQVLLSFRKTPLFTYGDFFKGKVVQVIGFFIIGFYGGMIQMGVGILLLVLLRQSLAGDWTKANYYKLLIVMIYTVPTTVYFIYIDMILWKPAILLTVGQIIGAYASGYMMIKKSWVQRVIPYFILVMILITTIRLLVS